MMPTFDKIMAIPSATTGPLSLAAHRYVCSIQMAIAVPQMMTAHRAQVLSG